MSVLDELPLFTDDELLLCTPAELDTIEALYRQRIGLDE